MVSAVLSGTRERDTTPYQLYMLFWIYPDAQLSRRSPKVLMRASPRMKRCASHLRHDRWSPEAENRREQV